MRSAVLLSILMATTLGACDQSLTHDMTGTGGTGTGGWIATGGGAGGANPGTGGLGGGVGALCNTLAAEYQSALSEAQTCQVGAPGQCQQTTSGTLYGCSCPTHVTNSSALETIESAWEAAGCVVPTPCGLYCPVALNSTCVSTDGGSAGTCSYVPGTGGTGGGATGGSSGFDGSTGDGGLSLCGMLVAEYAAVLVGARSCAPGATGQCGQAVLSELSPCALTTGCMEFVTDASVLDAIRQNWETAGCGNVVTICPDVACAPPATAACLPSDAGGSFCSTGYQSITTTN